MLKIVPAPAWSKMVLYPELPPGEKVPTDTLGSIGGYWDVKYLLKENVQLNGYIFEKVVIVCQNLIHQEEVDVTSGRSIVNRWR